MSLPLAWTDRIFTKLTLTYGQAFLARWRDLDLDAVKADWGRELSAFQQSPARIAFALENLPEKPPSVIEFKNLCAQYRVPESHQLPSPKADPERVAAELDKLAAIRVVEPSYDCKAWAKTLIREHESGCRGTPGVLAMARRALGLET